MNKGGYMTKLIITISFLLVLGSPFANAEQVYYCASEISTGIDKDEKTGMWEQYKFQSKRYTIKFSSDFSTLNGMDKTSWTCRIPYKGLKEFDKIVVCYHRYNSGMVFMFDSRTNRFLHASVSIFGYLLNFDDKSPDTDVIHGGTCQKF